MVQTTTGFSAETIAAQIVNAGLQMVECPCCEGEGFLTSGWHDDEPCGVCNSDGELTQAALDAYNRAFEAGAEYSERRSAGQQHGFLLA